MLNKLRLKFVAMNMAIIAAMLLAIFGLIYSSTHTQMQIMADNAMQTLTQGANTGVDAQLPYFTVDVYLNGRISVSGISSGAYELSDRAFIEGLIQKVFTADGMEGELENYELRYCRVEGIGVQRIVFLDLSSQKATLQALVRTGVMVGLAALTVFFGISWVLATWAVRPVKQAWQHQTQFISDASHELKTPLSVILSSAELLESGRCSEEDIGRFAGNIRSASVQMRLLTEGMLELARADNGQAKKHFAPVELSQLLEQTALPYEPLFFEKGLRLQTKIQPGITVTGSDRYLKQLAEILLDNACKYADPGTVRLQLERSRNHCVLCVENPGAPIPIEERDRLFDRFYRRDSARNDEGFGLGLAIAKNIAEEHAGSICVECVDGKVRFLVQLPCTVG